ncbi:hypothetical protein [Actinophytocola gossypii]|uniref:Uncharacterized protein n=1 Tax=Actinophytocola gossypii TaxID=2812003 RepID=A0ABT2JE21_9PSEU|nr:hypothetical protein [Actinophytocola gossypii]MCT2585519.1 hypothetical protein [Actinophytocola gossypii]
MPTHLGIDTEGTTVYVDENAAPTHQQRGMRRLDQAATTLGERMADVAALNSAVRSGDVVLEPEAGDKLVTTLRRQADAAADWLQRLRGMSRPVPLGSNWVGEAMSGKFQGRAAGEDVSFTSVLDQYHRMLLQALDAVREAMRRYQETEDGNETLMRRLDSRLYQGVTGDQNG